MSGFVYKGASTQTGVPYYLPQWYADLFASVDGIRTAYIAGWANEVGGYLVNGPDERQMTQSGSGADIAVASRAALGGEPAITFGGKVIDTGHMPSGDDCTLIAVCDITSEMAAGGSGASALFYCNASTGGGVAQLQVNNSGVFAWSVATSPVAAFVSAGNAGAGRYVLMATRRRTSPTQFLARIYCNAFVTPIQESTLTTGVGLNATWTLGGRLDGASRWRGGVSAAIIMDRDVTADATDFANVRAALDAAMIWSS